MEKVPVFLMFKNQRFWTLKVLEHLFKNTKDELYDLVLINNGSNRECVKFILHFLENNNKKYNFVDFENQIGVSLAYMESIQKYVKKDNDCFVILHNDVLVTSNWLEKLLNIKQNIDSESGFEWSCIFPRTNYCNEESVSQYDQEIKNNFLKIKPSSKIYFDNKTIEEHVEDVYKESNGIDEYSSFIEKKFSNMFKICQEICCFCTLFNKESFLNNGGFDADFINRGSECKILNEKNIENDHYPVLCMDTFVHHHGNLTTDGPGEDFSISFNDGEKIYKEKNAIYLKEKITENRIKTKLYSGSNMLFIRDGGVGDIIMSMFSLQCLKNKFHKTKITYMTKSENLNFVKNFSCIDNVVPIQLRYSFDFLDKDKTVDNEEKISVLSERFNFIKNWIKYVEYEDVRDVHRIEKFAESLPIKGIVPTIPEYKIDKKSETKVLELLKNIKEEKIVICMDGSCEIRSIPKEVAYKIIELESQNKKVFVLGNKEKINKKMFKMQKNIIDLGFSLKIEEIACLIKNSSYVYTPDTGIFHIASLLGVPSKAFFGSIDPDLRDGGYYGVKNKIYYKKNELPCVPCRDLGCKEILCMKYTDEEIERIVNDKC
jgi:ADP-heptose:LPS heptosyltransferase